jgi:hypothetical protein
MNGKQRTGKNTGPATGKILIAGYQTLIQKQQPANQRFFAKRNPLINALFDRIPDKNTLILVL